MILLCENNTGYQNLIKLVSLGFTEGFYNKPRIDDGLLEQYHEGLIALEKAVYYRDLFGRENFFIELQDHGIEEEQRILPGLARIAAEAGVGLVATNDSHYIEKEDSRTHGILLCIQTGSTVSDENKMEFQTDEFYLKTEDEMRTKDRRPLSGHLYVRRAQAAAL